MSADQEGDDEHNFSCDLFDEDDEDFVYSSLSNQQIQTDPILDCAKTVETLCDDSSSSDIMEVNMSPCAAKEQISNKNLEPELACSTVAESSPPLSSGELHFNNVITEYNPHKRHKSEDHCQFDDSSTFCRDKSFTVTGYYGKPSTALSEDSALKRLSHSHTGKSVQSSNEDNGFVQTTSLDSPKYSISREIDKLVSAMEHEEKQLNFSCPFCCVQETCVLSLEQHIFTAHPDLSDNPADSFDGEGAFSAAFLTVCPLCDIDLETESALAAHLTTVHSEEEDSKSSGNAEHLSCPLCDATCISEKGKLITYFP